MLSFLKRLVGYKEIPIQTDLPDTIRLELNPSHFMIDGKPFPEELLYKGDECGIANALKEYLGERLDNITPLVHTSQVFFNVGGFVSSVYNIEDERGMPDNLDYLYELVKQEEEFDGETNIIVLTRKDEEV